MSWDYVSIGPVPYEEECAQVGSPDYGTRSREECRRFADQIERHYPVPEFGFIGVKTFSHDFGSYREVVIHYEETCPDAVRWAFAVEGDEKDVLRFWD